MPLGVRVLLVLLFAIVLLRIGLPGALQFLFPGSVRQAAEPHDQHPPGSEPDAVRNTEPALTALGFERLGVRREQPLLARAMISYDYVQRAEKTYASMYALDRKSKRLYFFTPYDGGTSVLTADHRRPGAALDGYYLAGGLKDAKPDQVWAAHKRQLTAMEETGRERVAKGTMADRMDAGRAWFDGAGKRELRLRNVTPLALTTMALIILYSALASVPWGHWDRMWSAPVAPSAAAHDVSPSTPEPK